MEGEKWEWGRKKGREGGRRKGGRELGGSLKFLANHIIREP